MVYAIIIGQGELPRAMLEAARAIVPDVDGVSTLSNRECPVGELRSRLEQAITALPDGDDVIVFADMFGTSCANAGLEVKQSHSRVAVLSGVNLSMVVRFLYHRHRKPFAELVPFLVETGRGAVQAIEL
jgi:PTS system mannose-specific IIA component